MTLVENANKLFTCCRPACRVNYNKTYKIQKAFDGELYNISLQFLLLKLKSKAFPTRSSKKNFSLKNENLPGSKLPSNLGSFFESSLVNITMHRQAILLLFVESGTRKLRKVEESRTKFLFDVKRVLDSTTVLVLDSTPMLLL